jgi:hypothetical protein
MYTKFIGSFFSKNGLAHCNHLRLDFNNAFDLRCDSKWKSIGTDSAPCMIAFLPKYLHKEITSAINDTWLLLKIIRTRYKPDNLYNLLDVVQSSKLVLECSKNVDRACLCRIVPFFNREVGTKFSFN